jgi:hypothetical protein
LQLGHGSSSYRLPYILDLGPRQRFGLVREQRRRVPST